jgi:hypothetical protein
MQAQDADARRGMWYGLYARCVGGWRTSGRRKHRGAALARLCSLSGALGLFGAVLTACSPGPPAAGATGTFCGTARTGAGVPVRIKVAKGTVDCGTVLRVERDYAALIAAGRVRGNGGGAPVKVDGWTCQGYATPATLRTGNASECHTASAEVVAVLSSPASPGASPAGS